MLTIKSFSLSQEANVQRAAEERMAQQRREREEAEQRRKQVSGALGTCSLSCEIM